MSSESHGVKDPDPPPSNPPPKTVYSYAEQTKMNVKYDQRLKRNVLEIEVVKTNVNDDMNLSHEVLAKLLQNIGINIETHTEGCQVNYGGKSSKISILCKAGVDLERFCRQESFQVCKGVVTKNIRPAGRQDVTVTVSGLHFNTPDTLVQDYITKFGGVLLSRNVIYGKYSEGPFKGKVNGDRKYQVDFTSATTTMGTYHFLDGERIRIYYRGNTKTCGRCHQGPGQCPGGGIARECQDMGGQRKDLIGHMKELWNQIGFSPTSFKIPEREEDDQGDLPNLGGDQQILDMINFPRPVTNHNMTPPEQEKFSKVRITNFPLELSPTDALEFMRKKVDKEIADSDIEILKDHRSSQIIFGPGPSKAVVLKAQELLDFTTSHQIVYPDRKLYAKLHKPLSPEKSPPTKPESEAGVVKLVVNDLENKEDKKKNFKPFSLAGTPSTSQAKLASAGIAQLAKHKQGLGAEKPLRK